MQIYTIITYYTEEHGPADWMIITDRTIWNPNKGLTELLAENRDRRVILTLVRRENVLLAPAAKTETYNS